MKLASPQPFPSYWTGARIPRLPLPGPHRTPFYRPVGGHRSQALGSLHGAVPRPREPTYADQAQGLRLAGVAGVAVGEGARRSVAGDVVPGAPEERDRAEEHGFLALHFLAELGGHPGVPLAVPAPAPAPAVHCVPLAI